MTCAEVMTREPTCCELGDSAARVARIMRSADVGAIPVCVSRKNRKLVGIVTDRDIAIEVVAKGCDGETPVARFMTPNPFVCRPEDDLRHALEAMQQHQVRRIPVVNWGGQVVGIIALADVALRTTEAEKKAEMVEQISLPEPVRAA